jgi:mannose-6-phosphate isomerase-like protein (cupin superfamily)
MATIRDVSIINWNRAEAKPVASGLERTICSKDLCGSKTLDVYHRTVSKGRKFEVQAGDKYHLVYVIEAPNAGNIIFKGQSHAAEAGAGVLLAPGETATFEASGGDLQLLHMVTPRPPAAVEEGLPGGPGYFFNRNTLRRLSDASGGRVRRFCAESSVRLLDGKRLTPTNAIQAGEMHYREGGSSPYHRHVGTAANPDGASHCYITFKGRGMVQVGDDTQVLEPGTLVYFPPGVPHRLRAHGGPLDYFEIQAWRSFKTDVLSEEKLGLKWYYDPVSPGAARVEWDQS